ncbi:MAG: hypothetical protein ABIP29_03255 [Candidatus Eisenbacteria bacterium]
MEITGNFGVWVAAALTLFIFSFLYKDNPFYKFAEHLFVGVSAGYIVVQQYWQVLWPNLLQPMTAPDTSGRWKYYVGALLCLLLFTRLFSSISWMSRFTIAALIGTFAGLKVTGFAQAEVIEQVRATMVPLWNPADPVSSLNHLILVVGVITTLVFFFFSKEHKGAIGATAKVGIWYLMVSFGAAYGFTVMSRISLLIGRFQFLLDDWLGIVRF